MLLKEKYVWTSHEANIDIVHILMTVTSQKPVL